MGSEYASEAIAHVFNFATHTWKTILILLDDVNWF